MRLRDDPADSLDMESGRGRVRRAEHGEDARQGLRAGMQALRHELEMLDGVLDAGPTPISARASLDRAFFSLRAAERAWRDTRDPRGLMLVVRQLEATRYALDDSLESLRRRAARTGR